MTDKELLQKKYDSANVTESDLSFGRTMPFGKYKGKYIYYLLVKHHRYMQWALEGTSFTLTETERWWKNKIDTVIELAKADRLISGLCGQMNLGGMDNIENPHSIVE